MIPIVLFTCGLLLKTHRTPNSEKYWGKITIWYMIINASWRFLVIMSGSSRTQAVTEVLTHGCLCLIPISWLQMSNQTCHLYFFSGHSNASKGSNRFLYPHFSFMGFFLQAQFNEKLNPLDIRSQLASDKELSDSLKQQTKRYLKAVMKRCMEM